MISRIARPLIGIPVAHTSLSRSVSRFSPRMRLSSINATRSLSSSSDVKMVEFKCGDEVYKGKGKIGDTLLDVVINNDLALDGFGACEGTLACCTCHVVLNKDHFDRVDLINPAGEEELDLLDLAPELDDHSRLGCQIKLDKEDPDTVVVIVPTHKRDARQL